MPKLSPITQSKLDKLRLYYTDEDSFNLIDGYEKRLRDIIKKKALPAMGAVIEIVQAGQKVIDDINIILQTEKNIETRERDRLFERRDCYQFWVNRLSGKNADQEEASIEALLDHRIKIIEDK